MSQNNNIIESLGVLGLKEKHARAYVALLELERASPHKIAQQANVERTTIYKILDELAEKGLVVKIVTGKRITYRPESPRIIQDLITKQSHVFEKILPQLLSLKKDGSTEPSIKLYTTKESIGRVVMNSLQSKEKLCRDFASVENVVEMFGTTFVEHYINERVRLGVEVRSLRHTPSDSKSETPWYLKPDNPEVLREVRYLDKAITFDSFIKIYDDTIVMISSPKETFALVVESTDLANAMKILFDIAWKSAQE